MDYLNKGLSTLTGSKMAGGRKRKSHRKRKHRGGGNHVSPEGYGANAMSVGGRRSRKSRKSRKSRRRH